MTSTHRQLRILVGLLFILALLAAGSVYGAPSGNIIYVKHDAVGNDDGSSWADAYMDLQDALGTAEANDEIWVAQGVYYPAPTAIDRNATFELVDGVALYGGFAGTETERDQRDWEANITVLSGDLDRDDITDSDGVVTDRENLVGDNAYHVVTGGGVTQTAVLDGFTITAGKADGTEGNEKRGGGMYNDDSSPELTNLNFSGNYATSYGGGMYNDDSSPELTNVNFSGNYALFGGGMYNTSSSPKLTGVEFSDNEASSNGGGMYNYKSSPTLTNIAFSGNQADFSGGGMSNALDSRPTLTNVTFRGNYAGYGGGGMDNYLGSQTLTNVTFRGNESERRGGGMLNSGGRPTLTNVTFSGNRSEQGGGMYNTGGTNPALINVTITGNSAEQGGGIRNQYGTPVLVNCIVWGNSPDSISGEQSTITYSDIEGGYPGDGNIDADPLFVDPLSADEAPATAGDYRLTEGSPAIDAGTNDVVTVDIDLEDNPRIVDGSGDGSAIVDMGAFEFQLAFGQVYLPLVVRAFSGHPPSFQLGGHIRDWSFPHADQMRYAGMNWATVRARYPEDVSGIIAASHARGFKIQVKGSGPADMVTQLGFEQDVANWLAGMAVAGADAIEVWNEPNIDREWQSGHISPALYTDLLCASYHSIKAANSDTLVISAAPAPTGFFGGCSPAGCDDVPWLQALYAEGAANCTDYLGAHHASGATSPSARSGHPANPSGTHHSWYFLWQTEEYYGTFQGTVPLFYTMLGYASQEGVPPFSNWFAWATGTSNADQAAWLAEAAELSISTGMVDYIMIWNIDFPRYGYDPMDGYAIIRPDESCPACESLHELLGAR